MKSIVHLLIIASLGLGVQPLSAAEAASVATATFAELAMYPQRSAPATVVSLNVTAVAAEIPAKIEALNVRVGDIVEKDQVLVELNCIDYRLEQEREQARLQSIEARIELAERRLQRTRKLTMQQSVSEEVLDERESDLAALSADKVAARASLDLARVHVATCVIKSPFRALVTERISAIGNYAEIGKPLISLLDIEQLEVSAQVNAEEVYQLEEAGQLLFVFNNKNYPLHLRRILPSINTETRNSEVRLLFDKELALPGAAGKLLWDDVRPHIPGKLVVRREGKLGVFVVDEGHARFIALPGAQAGVASPGTLPLSSLLVTEGHYSLNDNDAVVTK